MKYKIPIYIYIRFSFAILIIFSIIVTFWVMVIQKDFKILTNSDGPDTSDYLKE